MNIFLYVLMIIIFPFSIQAYKLTVDKVTLINKSSNHYYDAVKDLQKSENICWYLPDADQKEHLHALITGVIYSATVKDPRAIILSIALPLLVSICIDASDKYNEMMLSLANSEYHLNMGKFYNELSLTQSLDNYTDKGTKLFFQGIDYLTKAIISAESMHPEFGVNAKLALVIPLDKYRQDFIKNQKHLGSRGYTLYENMGEVMCDCNVKYREEITDFLYEMYGKFKDAERAWKKDKKK
jgi:hypothetical protein